MGGVRVRVGQTKNRRNVVILLWCGVVGVPHYVHMTIQWGSQTVYMSKVVTLTVAIT